MVEDGTESAKAPFYCQELKNVCYYFKHLSYKGILVYRTNHKTDLRNDGNRCFQKYVYVTLIVR